MGLAVWAMDKKKRTRENAISRPLTVDQMHSLGVYYHPFNPYKASEAKQTSQSVNSNQAPPNQAPKQAPQAPPRQIVIHSPFRSNQVYQQPRPAPVPTPGPPSSGPPQQQFYEQKVFYAVNSRQVIGQR